MNARNGVTSILLWPAIFFTSSALGQATVVVSPDVMLRSARDQPTWDDRAQHYKLRITYDGRRATVKKATMGDGEARSYISQRADIVVLVLDADNQVLRRFNIPDPLEVRAWDRASVSRPQIDTPTRFRAQESIALEKSEQVSRNVDAGSKEHGVRVPSTEFDLFVPLLPDATHVELRRKSPRGSLLTRVSLGRRIGGSD